VCLRVISAKHTLRVLCVDAKHHPQGAIGSDVAGVGNATTGSMTDKLTREHRMTLDEAHLVLNTKHADGIERILQVRPSGFGRGRSSEINATALVLVKRRLEL